MCLILQTNAGGGVVTGDLRCFHGVSWDVAQPTGALPSIRFGHGLVAGSDNRLYLFAGHNGTIFVAAVCSCLYSHPCLNTFHNIINSNANS